MARAVSIHIGVNAPADHDVHLRESERSAWRMAQVASQAKYDSILVLRGAAATRQAVHDALAGAAGRLEGGDMLFLSFSGHGGHAVDRDLDERHGSDESWCLSDDVLVDDKLAGYWRLFEPGVRIVVVAESCYSGGMDRTGRGRIPMRAEPRVMRGTRRGMREAVYPGAARERTASCIVEPPRDACEIRASVLMLTAATEAQTAEDGLFTDCLVTVWAEGTFPGSYCDLYRTVKDAVMTRKSAQEPQILMLGTPDPAFPLARAFYPSTIPPPAPPRVYR